MSFAPIAAEGDLLAAETSSLEVDGRRHVLCWRHWRWRVHPLMAARSYVGPRTVSPLRATLSPSFVLNECARTPVSRVLIGH